MEYVTRCHFCFTGACTLSFAGSAEDSREVVAKCKSKLGVTDSDRCSYQSGEVFSSASDYDCQRLSRRLAEAERLNPRD